MSTGSSRSRSSAALILAVGIAGCVEDPASNEPPAPPPAQAAPIAMKSAGRKKVQGPADLVTKPPQGGGAMK